MWLSRLRSGHCLRHISTPLHLVPWPQGTRLARQGVAYSEGDFDSSRASGPWVEEASFFYVDLSRCAWMYSWPFACGLNHQHRHPPHRRDKRGEERELGAGQKASTHQPGSGSHPPSGMTRCATLFTPLLKERATTVRVCLNWIMTPKHTPRQH